MTGQTAENELIAQLQSDKRSVRIQAIVKLTRVGQSEHSLKALLPYLASDDRELSFFASQAANKIAQKAGLDLKSFLENQPADNTEEPESLPREIFLSPAKDKINELLHIIRNNPEKISESALPAVGVFLGKHGDINDAAFIEKQLLKDNSNLSLPFISAAENIANLILPRVLPNLLASREPLVRSRSISALRRIDPEEAERHFSDLLASRNPENRLAGIGIALLFPFGRVKGYLLSLLPEEKDSEVLTACQTVLASNPEVDTALSILDSIDAVAAEQKGKLSQVFKEVCNAIVAAGILPLEKASPESLVKVWKQQRLQSFLFDLEIQIPFADDKKKLSIIDWIMKNRQHPKVGELIERLGKNPQTEDIYRQLSRPLPGKSNLAAPVNNKEASQGVQPDNDAAKLLALKAIELDTLPENRSWIMQEAAHGTAKVRTEALNTLLRVRPDIKLKDLAKNAMAENDNEVRIAGFKILERIDPDFLKGKISELMLESDPHLRVRAIRFGLKFEEKASIEALRNLLNSPEQNLRSNAINCLALCPFPLVFKMLMNQLDREDHPVLARQITNILMSNPSKSVLKALDSITRTSNPAVAMVISQARNDLFEIVAQMPAAPTAEPVDSKAETQEKPYSVSSVREIASRNQNWKPSYKTDGKPVQEAPKSETNWQMIISGSVILIFLGFLPIMLLSDHNIKDEVPRSKPTQDYRTSERVKPVETEVPAKFRMNRVCSLNGIVKDIVSDANLVMLHEGSEIMVKFEGPEAKPFKKDDKISVTIVPYRVNPNGVILSRGQKITAAEGK